MIASLNQFQNEVMQDSALQEQFKTVAATSLENLFTTSEVEQALVAQNAATETGELSELGIFFKGNHLKYFIQPTSWKLCLGSLLRFSSSHF